MSTPKELGYWCIMGLAQQIRLLLKAAKVDFIDKQYTPETAADWFAKDKPSMISSGQTNLPNLPYLKMDDGSVIVESGAIMRFLGEKYGYWGSNIDERYQSEQIYGAVKDVYDKFYRFVACQNTPKETYENKEKRDKWHTEIYNALNGPISKELAKLKLSSGNESQLTWVDFSFLYIFTLFRAYSNEIKNIKEIDDYIQRVLNVGGQDLKNYYEESHKTVRVIVANYWYWGDGMLEDLEPVY